MTKPISQMSREELIWAIEGFAASARRSFDAGKDPWPTLSRVRSMINHYKDAAEVREEIPEQQSS